MTPERISGSPLYSRYRACCDTALSWRRQDDASNALTPRLTRYVVRPKKEQAPKNWLTICNGNDATTKACSLRILIVEDDAAMARGLAERLKLSGFAVDIESDGASAAETALLEPYSLIILDTYATNSCA